MKIAFIAMALLVAAPLAQADGNGEHPAIVARRVIASQGFDHASAFYRHPAGLSLATEAPRSTMETSSLLPARGTGLKHPAAARVLPRK
jgi:hypothetical protein